MREEEEEGERKEDALTEHVPAQFQVDHRREEEEDARKRETPIGTILGPSWDHLGSFVSPLGDLLGPSWLPLGPSGGTSIKEGGSPINFVPSEPGKSPLGSSWGVLEALLGALGAVVEPLWAPLTEGVLWRCDKARQQYTLRSCQFLTDTGLLGVPSEGSVANWSRLGAVLGPLGGMLDAILSHLGLFCAILEAILGDLGPPWNHLGPSWTF